MTIHDRRDWHAGARQSSWTALDTNITGLSEAEAADRLRSFGPNALPVSARRHPVLRFLAHFNSA